MSESISIAEVGNTNNETETPLNSFESSAKKEFFPDIPKEKWEDAQWQKENTIGCWNPHSKTARTRFATQIKKIFSSHLSKDDINIIIQASSERKVAITPYEISLVQIGNDGMIDTADPVWQQFMPVEGDNEPDILPENYGSNWERAEEAVAGGIAHHKYPDRVIVRLCHFCPGTCSFCFEICYGVETVDPEMASKYDKTRDNDLTNQVLGLTSDAGIIPRAMMIVGGPNETQETLNKLISWAKESPALSFRIAYFTPFQGTPDWHIANQEEQWLSEEFKNNLEHHTTEEPVLKAPIIIEDGRVDNEELEKFRKFKTEALKEIYNSPEYHAKIKKFINKHPDKVVMVRGLIYLFERQGLAEEGSFNYLF